MAALSDRYKLLRVLPGARNTTVSMAADRIHGEVVVLKTAAEDEAWAPEVIAEGRRLEELRHPGLVRLVERFEGRIGPGGAPVVGHSALWVDGEPLSDWSIHRPRDEVLRAFQEAASTVAWLHHQGWLHLDLKPENILGTRDRPVLLDLGSARPLDTLAGTAGGTLGYAAPEVVLGEAPSRASDVFSLGVILYEVLLHRSPFGDEEGSALRSSVLEGRIVPPRAYDRTMDPRLSELILEMLQVSPGSRISSVDAVVQRLAAVGYPPGAGKTYEPPWFGRVGLVESLLERLGPQEDRRGAVVALLGPPGAGRRRLARQILAAARRTPDSVHLDLSDSPSPLRDIGRLLQILGAPTPDPREPSMSQWLATARLDGALGVGLLDRWPPADVMLAATFLPAVAASGLSILLGAEHLVPWAEPHALAPLDDDSIARIADWLGAPPGPTVAAVVHAAQGNPGEAAEYLRRARTPPAAIPETDAARLVFGLPEGAPECLAEIGPMVQPFRQAEAAGWIRRKGRRLLPAVQAPSWAVLSEADREWAAEILELTKDEDPLWRLSLAARVGSWDTVRRGLENVDGYRARPELRGISRQLGETGDVRGLALYADLLMDDKQHAEASTWIGKLPKDAPEAAILLARMDRDLSPAAGFEIPRQWRQRFGWDPGVAAAEAYGYVIADRRRDLGTFLEEALRDCPEMFRQPLGAAARLAYAIEKHKEDGDPAPLDAILAETEFHHPDLQGVPRLVLYYLGQAYRARGDFQRGLQVGLQSVEDADRQGNLQAAIAARTALASLMISNGQASPARALFQQAESLAVALRDDGQLLRIYASLAEVETRTLRLPAAERYLRLFDATRARLPRFREAEVRRSILWAALEAARGRPQVVLDFLRELDVRDMPMRVRAARDIYLIEAMIELGAWSEALQTASQTPTTEDEDVQRRLHVARARIHFAMGRYNADRALENLPAEPDPLHRESVGRALLAAGGEDLDPSSFAVRKRLLARSAELLPEKLRPRAVELRERMLEGPAAALRHVVDLIEAVGSTERLMKAVAHIVQEVLGANRVLVLMRLPGLGQQFTALEISGQEVAGLANEIFRRLESPFDVWKADDAFADPNLRRMSATVRTFQVRSVMAVAIPKDGQLIGALYVDDTVRTGRFGPADVAVLQRLASAIGAVASLIPTRAPDDGLVVHDVLGVYMCDERKAQLLNETLEDLAHGDPSNILISGPTGVGKTWTARRLATEVLGLDGTVEVVLRPGEPQMLVSELSGTRRGEFTGAIETVGAVRRALAENKALFLDEIQNLDELGQRVLLPLLELPKRRFGGLTGGVRELEGPLHVILGTNADLDGGKWRTYFREDLWYRISANRLDIPPLAARGREAIYRHLGDAMHDRGLPAPEHVLERPALARLATHAWPGNLRSLMMLADRIGRAYRRTARPLAVEELPLDEMVDEATPPAAPVPAASSPLQQAEVSTLIAALEANDWSQAAAAKDLGISKYAMLRLIKRHDLLEHVRRNREER